MLCDRPFIPIALKGRVGVLDVLAADLQEYTLSLTTIDRKVTSWLVGHGP
jgi:hypothetical protein